MNGEQETCISFLVKTHCQNMMNNSVRILVGLDIRKNGEGQLTGFIVTKVIVDVATK